MNNVVRYNPYGRPAGPGLFTYRNARAAWNLGQKAGSAAKKAYSSYKSNSTPMKTTHTTKTVKKAGGRGYKKVQKDTVTSKHARKAIANVVHRVLNQEQELHKTPWLYANFTSANRVCYIVDLATIPQPGDATHQYTGNEIHVSSVKLLGRLNEATANRGIPSKFEIMLIERRGPLNMTGSTALAGTNFSGNLYNVAEDNFVKQPNSGDNTPLGRKAILAPQLRGFKILSRKTVTVKQNTSYNGTTPKTRSTPFDVALKVDKTIRPQASFVDEDNVDQKRVFLVVRGLTPDDDYNSTNVCDVNAQMQINFRDA